MKRGIIHLLELFLALMMMLSLSPTALAVMIDDGSECPNPYSPTHGGHVWDMVSTEDANCQHGIIEHYTCKGCGATTSFEYGSLGDHTWGPYQNIDPTCTEYGGTRRECSVCGEVEEMWEIVPLGHDFRTESLAPTCTEDGYERSVCARCGEVEYDNALPATGHTESTVPGREPTCTEDGLTEGSVCAVCGAVLTAQQTIPALGHHWDGGTVTAQPTCTQEGVITYRCTNTFPTHACTETRTESIPALGHDWGEWTVETPGTCVQQETRVRSCNRCGVTENSLGSYGGHIFGAWKQIKAPTATEPGLEERICVYDESHRQQREIPATGGEAPVPTEPETPQDEIKPGLTTTASWAPDEGKGKAYVGAEVEYTITDTNTGNCTLTWYYNISLVSAIGPNGSVAKEERIQLEPGQSVSWTKRDTVTKQHVDYMEYGRSWSGTALYTDANGKERKLNGDRVSITIPLTYPDGEVPEEKKAGLLLTFNYDKPAKDVYDPDDMVSTSLTLTNTGNVPLIWGVHIRALGGDFDYNVSSGNSGFWRLNPGQSKEVGGLGYVKLKDGVTPGTGTEELLGIATASEWFSGYDVDTLEELCTSNTVSRSWKVRKPGPTAWEIPEESAVSAVQYELSNSADPAGYQLGEEVRVNVRFLNTGTVDIDSYTVDFPFSNEQGIKNILPLQVNKMQTWYVGGKTPGSYVYVVEPEDVEHGYISFPPVIMHWTDPDSGNEKTAYSNPLILPVISKTGLLVHKGIAQGPANGSCFVEGEQVQWTVTVTNTSKEPIKNVVVTDQGVTIGTFAQIAPGEMVNCAVPGHTVTDYDVAVTYVSNTASATGTDSRGTEHTWQSNEISVPTSALSNVPLPSTGGPGSEKTPGDGGESVPAPGLPETPDHPGTPGGGPDPKGPIYGSNVAVTLYKTTAHGPANGLYYELGEQVDYLITAKNEGDVVLDGLSLSDSLAGLGPIGSLGSLAPGEEHAFTFQHTVTQADIDAGYVANTAFLTYSFKGVGGTPVQSNIVYVIAGKDGHLPGEGVNDGIPGSTPDGAPGSFPGLTPGGEPTPIPGPDGKPIPGPDGGPIYAPPGTVPVIDPDGAPVLSPDGDPVYVTPDGTHFVVGPDGKPILTDEKGNPILDKDGNPIYLDFNDTSCRLELNALGSSELRYTLHACYAHVGTACMAETASPAEAAALWREEIDELYEILYAAGNDEGKAAVVNDRLAFYATIDAYTAMGPNDPAVQQNAVNLLREKCAELCCMIHTVPDTLPSSLLGSYATLMSGEVSAACGKEITALQGSDSELILRYDRARAQVLNDEITLLNATDRYHAEEAFTRAQRFWQMALDNLVGAQYKAADREARKPIAAWRTQLDQLLTARKGLLELLYEQNPDVPAEALETTYRTAVTDFAAAYENK